MSNTRSLTDIVSDQSTKLNELLNKLDLKLKIAISKLPVEIQLELYDKLNKQYLQKLEGLKEKK